MASLQSGAGVALLCRSEKPYANPGSTDQNTAITQP